MSDNRTIGWLNRALQHEFGAVQQYLAQSVLARLLGDAEGAERWRDEALEELAHAERLMERLIQLGAAPSAGALPPARLGRGPQDFDGIVHAMEWQAVRLYQDAAEHAQRMRDEGTHALMQELLQAEVQHFRNAGRERIA
ncbi:ferritin-like domain-containing protein [Tepidimonas charontis]|uniref:Bacterioferritin n=1 Tax=Tepidimonas charontis TaxID=2267262 RepID=A0A554XHW1_9BURK|nr:ferritin-like domain-containing protein [Tepidimonas charontis]TSE35403.1 Bacterioferritin [Tepidimonas charontis]